jgi:hypothetical protein
MNLPLETLLVSGLQKADFYCVIKPIESVTLLDNVRL